MTAPVTPNDIKGCISDPSGRLCGNFLNTLLKFPVLVYKLVNWMFDSSGNLSDAMLRSINPSGSLLFTASAAVPAGYLLCNGSQVLRSTYADLFTSIGTIYGVGDGVNTFNLPDYRDKFPVGAGTSYAIGATGGEAKHKLVVAESPKHEHFIANNETSNVNTGTELDSAKYMQGNGRFDSFSTEYRLGGSATPATIGKTSSVGSADDDVNLPHNNLPPYVACFIYIKT